MKHHPCVIYETRYAQTRIYQKLTEYAMYLNDLLMLLGKVQLGCPKNKHEPNMQFNLLY